MSEKITAYSIKRLLTVKKIEPITGQELQVDGVTKFWGRADTEARDADEWFEPGDYFLERSHAVSAAYNRVNAVIAKREKQITKLKALKFD